MYEERNNSQFDGDSDILEVLTVGGGRLFLHVVAAAFLEMRHSVFSCKNYDDLLQLCNQMPAQQFSVSRLLEKAKVLLGKNKGRWRSESFPKRGGSYALSFKIAEIQKRCTVIIK